MIGSSKPPACAVHQAWVVPAHPPDQVADLLLDSRSLKMTASAFPGPEQTESLAAPSDHRLGLDD